MKISLQEKKVGLALGGGGVLGAAHIGVLKALNELNVSIHAVAGTSIGALIASLFAFEKDWQDIEGVLTDLNWLNPSELSLSQYAVLSNKKLGDLITQNLGEVSFEEA
ncbi:MAG: patatin-like phospholipase family protein, partial [Anaerolineales bacterium]|nr:patatin-like phospholipase family protein [Anaerolineales bacterium]